MDTKELTRRALEICIALNLEYMAVAGNYDPDDKENPFGEPGEGGTEYDQQVRRFMIYEKDAADDGWANFYVTQEHAEGRIAELASDGWGVSAVYDLERDDYKAPLKYEVKATIIV